MSTQTESFTFNRSNYQLNKNIGIPKGIRTPVTAVKGRCPRPLDEGDPDIYSLNSTNKELSISSNPKAMDSNPTLN